jgi:hypothetical protein
MLDLRAVRRRAIVARNDARVMRERAWRQRMHALSLRVRSTVSR